VDDIDYESAFKTSEAEKYAAKVLDSNFKLSQRICGLDVARFGDDYTALIIREGNRIRKIEQWGQIDLMKSVGRIVDYYRRGMFDRVHVDVIGLGSGVADRLREIGVPTLDVNVAEVSSMNEKYSKLRDELWFRCREWFVDKKAILNPAMEYMEELCNELSVVRYNYESNGKLKVEAKSEMKRRGIASPNLADALCLTFAEGITGGFDNNMGTKREVVVDNNARLAYFA